MHPTGRWYLPADCDYPGKNTASSAALHDPPRPARLLRMLLTKRAEHCVRHPPARGSIPAQRSETVPQRRLCEGMGDMRHLHSKNSFAKGVWQYVGGAANTHNKLRDASLMLFPRFGRQLTGTDKAHALGCDRHKTQRALFSTGEKTLCRRGGWRWSAAGRRRRGQTDAGEVNVRHNDSGSG